MRKLSAIEIILAVVSFLIWVVIGLAVGIWYLLLSPFVGILSAGKYFYLKARRVIEKMDVPAVIGVVLAPFLIAFIVLYLIQHRPPMVRHRIVKPPVLAKVPAKTFPPVTATIETPVIPDLPQPKMPLLAAKSGDLDGVLLVLDPGHGGKAARTEFGVDTGCVWQSRGQDFFEAAYTYREAKEVADLVRARGCDIIYTAWSPSMEVETPASLSMPLPQNPRLPSGASLGNGSAGLSARAAVATNALATYGKKYRLIVFVSLHIDAMASDGWQGIHVTYDGHAGVEPRYTELVAQAISDGHYARTYNGANPVAASAERYMVINGAYNGLRQRVLLETGIPGNDTDSWRLRNPESRRKMLQAVVVEPLVKLALEKEGK
ncbi:MAG: N-acetylmuramoyl-L-alanine amidase [Candidatus Berkelbacteria bacterium]|nr:N-acetylmuramoyl-L-alanine amidase [Candidatus Berkelbacteria bacterium]